MTDAVGQLSPPSTPTIDAENVRHAIQAAEMSVSEWRIVAEAGVVLHQSLDYETTLQAVARLAVPVLADYCVFDLIDGERLRRVAAAHIGSDRQAAVDRLPEIPLDLGGWGPVVHAVRIGQPRVITDWAASRHEWTDATVAFQRIVEALAPRSLLIVPLRDRLGEALGALTLVMTESGRRYRAADLRMAEALASRAAAAIENARLHREVLDARELLEQQTVELELQTQQMQDIAAELEAQQAELEQQTEELEVANEELIESREVAETARLHVSGILGAITDAFVVHDREWRFQYINDAAAQVFKSAGTGTAESIAGRLLWDLYPDIVGTGFEREMRRAQRDRVPVIFEQFYARRGRWTELHCYPMPDGGLATLWKDITEKKRAEERLRYVSQASAVLASSLDYRTTIAKLAELLVPELADWCGVQLADEHGTLQQLAVAHVDPTKVQWARELNARYPVDMSATTGAPQVLRSGVSELYGEITDEMLAAGAKDAEHLRILRDLGMTSALVVPLAARGRVIGVMSLISAESGRRYTDAEQALAEELAGRAAMAIDNSRLYTDAQEANRAKADFLAHMSHELRTPLNAIAGYAELMELGVHGPLTGEQFQDVLRIKRSQRHLLGLINDVLNFAKLEAGHVGYDLAPFVVRELVAQLEVLIAPQLAAKSLRYDIADIPAELVAHGDAERVQQILLNLLSNATKFTAAGGRIRVSARRDGEMLWIEVSDTGTGIATDKWNVVFEPFVQLERTFSSSHQGTGLGLAISRDLARGMGGDLVVRSLVGEGSTFSLILPAAER